MAMNARERREAIVQLITQEGFAPVERLAARFAVTPQTIRRDIAVLSEEGAIRRFHGGAGAGTSVENIGYAARQVLCLEEKRRIARLAAQHIPDHASMFINIGTTTEAVAQALLGHAGLRVITNNLNVANLLHTREGCEVMVAGGLVRQRDGGIIGEATMDLINQFRVDIGLIGISGIDLDGTLLDFDYREVRVARAIIANSRRVFLVTDHTKFGRTPMCRVGHLSEIDVLFTDRSPPRQIMERIGGTKCVVHVAE
jgi:DeoR family glycerol-3-phosphate regulon repressor